MSIQDGLLNKDNLNSSFLSKKASGTQIMAGSLRMLGGLTVNGVTILGAVTTGTLTTGAINAGSSTITTTGTVSAGILSGSLAATNLTGTIDVARLSATDVVLMTGTQTIAGNKTFSGTSRFNGQVNFANGTTYNITTAGHANLNNVVAAGTITINGNQLNFSGTQTINKIRLTGTDNYTIGVQPHYIVYGSSMTNNNDSIGHKFTRGNGEEIAQIGGGGSGTPANRLDSQFFGSVTINQNLEVQGEIKAGLNNEFPDPILASQSNVLWNFNKAPTATVVYDNVQAPVGTGALGSIRINATGDNAWALCNHTFDVNPSEWITFSCYAFCTTTSRTSQYYIEWLNASGTAILYSESTTTNTATGWTRYSVTAQAPATARRFRVRVDNDGGNGAIMYYSAFQVERGRAMSGFKSSADAFQIGQTATASTIGRNRINAISIDDVGRVGIGTINPVVGYSLTTSGNSMFSGGLTISAPHTQVSWGGWNGQLLILHDQNSSAGVGGSIVFGTNNYGTGGIGAYAEGTGTASYLVLANRGSSGNVIERLRIVSSGNVGIGNTNPAHALDVTGTIRASADIRLTGSNTLMFETHGGGFNMTDTTWIRTTGSKSFYSNVGVIRTDGALQVGASGATLNVAHSGNFNYKSGSIFGDWATGNVGFGTIEPKYPIDAVTGVGDLTALRLRTNGTANNTETRIRFTNTTNSDNTDEFSSYIAGVRTNSPTTGAHAIVFGVSTDRTAPSEVMRITPEGRLAIGKTTATVPLDVVGAAAFSGNITIGGTLSVSTTATITGLLTLGAQATGTGHAVRADRSISAGNGLTGGGNLTANRTLSVVYGGDGVSNSVARTDHTEHSSIKVQNKFSIEYNASEDSLDFIYVG